MHSLDSSKMFGDYLEVLNFNTGGSVCQRVKDTCANNHYFIGGLLLSILLFFHILSLYNFLSWIDRKGACITYNFKLI